MPRKAIRAKRVKQLARPGVAALGPAERPLKTRSAEDARAFAVDVARLLHDDKCEDVVILDLRGISPICDFFVIGSGTSDRQIRAVAGHVEALGRARDDPPFSMTGYDDGKWAVIDFVDVVIHLFDPEQRDYYGLETLWGDGPRVEWNR
jgi:ribosome-associated protein